MKCDELLSEIAASVQQRRRQLNLTQKELASMADVSERSVRSLEAGKAYGIGLENLVAILAPLGLCLSCDGVSTSKKSLAAQEIGPDPQDLKYESLLQQAVASWTSGGSVHD